MKLIIDRKRWLRGESGPRSALLRQFDGKMCCLGFLAKQCGAHDEDILECCYPYQIGHINWPKDIYMDDDTPLCIEISKINDSMDVSDDAREEQLKEKFGQIGIELEFK